MSRQYTCRPRAYRVIQRTVGASGPLIRTIWFVMPHTTGRLERQQAIRTQAIALIGKTPIIRAARDYRGPLVPGTVAYGPWRVAPSLDDFLTG